MLRSVRPFKPRFSLRLNERSQSFRVYNSTEKRYELLENRTFGSLTATCLGSADGRQLTVHSHAGHPQVIVVVHVATNNAVGAVWISPEGALNVADPPPYTAGAASPGTFGEQITMILGLPGHCTINLTNLLGEKEDIIRFNPGHTRWFIPHRYLEPTSKYDVEPDTTGVIDPPRARRRSSSMMRRTNARKE